MVGSMAPVMSQAVSNPIGVITGVLLLGTACVAIAIFQALSETRGSMDIRLPAR